MLIVSRVEASTLALPTRVPRAKPRHQHLSLGTVRRSAAHSTSIQDGGRGPCAVTLCPAIRSSSSTAAPLPREHRPLPADEIPLKQPQRQPVGESACSRSPAHTTPFSDQGIKLSFVSEPKKKKKDKHFLHDAYILSEGK